MSLIKPFKAIRPTSEFANQVAALPYDVMSSDEARTLVKNNAYSFLHIDKAEIDLPEETYIYSPEVYNKAKQNLDKLIQDKILVQDNSEYFYIYQLEMNNRKQTGLVACTSIDEYLDGKIKKHELTREDKEQDRINHVNICNAHTGPIFLTYRNQENTNKIIETWKSNKQPVYNFTADDNITHTVWVVDESDIIDQLITSFEQVPSLYIADGHHRNASAVKVGQLRREQNPSYTGEEGFNYCMSVLFPSNQLYIMDYNRVVKDLNGNTEEEFISKLKDHFSISKLGENKFSPQNPHEFGMYINKNWYKLTAKNNILENRENLELLDVAILQNNILTPILNIGDPRTDTRINFVGGIRGLDELEKLVNSGEYSVAFSMFPTSIDEVMNIADLNMIMPPKSTWFEPKLRSGLFIHSLD